MLGFENIELISDRPFQTWLDELKQLKWNYSKHVLVASIMEEYRREAWHETDRRTQDTGVDAFELNLSCPHGLPERKMGMAMGEGPALVKEVTGRVKEVSTLPVWAKMTPNVGSAIGGDRTFRPPFGSDKEVLSTRSGRRQWLSLAAPGAGVLRAVRAGLGDETRSPNRWKYPSSPKDAGSGQRSARCGQREEVEAVAVSTEGERTQALALTST